MSDVEQNPSPDRHLYAGFMRQFDEARRTVAALDTVFRDGNVEAVKDAQRIIRQLADRVQELEGKGEPRCAEDLARTMYARFPVYRGVNPIAWEDAPDVVRSEWMLKAMAVWPASPPSSVQPEKERRPLHIHEIHMWARRRARALGPEGVTDPVAFLEEGVRWGEARHGIGGGEC